LASTVKEKTNDLSIKKKSEMVDKVVELLISKERKGWEKRGEKKEEFKKLANKFGISERTIHNNYYRRVLPVVQEEEKKDDKESRKAKFQVIMNDAPVENKIEEDKKDDKKEDKKVEIKNDKQDKAEKIEATKTTTKPVAKPVTNTVIKKQEMKYDSQGRPVKPPYKVNDIIEVKVDHIKEYGVFCKTLDEYEYNGLLHISEIKDIFVSDPNDHFKVGDIINVKVIMAQPNRLNFSTRNLRVPIKIKEQEDVDVADVTLPKNPPINSIGEQFGEQLKSKINTYSVNKPQNAFKNEVEDILKEDDANIDNAEIEKLFESQLKEEEENEKNEAKKQEESNEGGALTPNKVSERDLADAKSFLNNKIGALSPKAQAKLIEVLDKKGMFKSTIAIGKVAENFVVDYGLIFMEMVAEELEKDECL
jgi:predicted RNA-binding protein with RPS1 domain